jgi:hypothetical protein
MSMRSSDFIYIYSSLKREAMKRGIFEKVCLPGRHGGIKMVHRGKLKKEKMGAEK